jgi:hypothetical protein
MGKKRGWFGGNNGRSFVMTQFDSRELTQNTSNFGGYVNRNLNSIFDRALSAPSAELAEQAWRVAARLLMDDVALVPLIEVKYGFARSQRVRNCTSNGGNCDPNSLWLADAAERSGCSR